eukprot:s432_g14.t1
MWISHPRRSALCALLALATPGGAIVDNWDEVGFGMVHTMSSWAIFSVFSLVASVLMAAYSAAGLSTSGNYVTDAAGNVRPLGATETTVAAFLATQNVANGAPTGVYSTVPESFIKPGAEINVVEVPPPAFWRSAPVQDPVPQIKGKGKGKGKFVPEPGSGPNLTGQFRGFQHGRCYVPQLDAELQKSSAGALPGAEAAANAGLRKGLIRTLAWMDLAVHGIPYEDGQAMIAGYPDIFGWQALLSNVDVIIPFMAGAYGLPDNGGGAPAPWTECNSGAGATNSEVRRFARLAAELVIRRNVGTGDAQFVGRAPPWVATAADRGDPQFLRDMAHVFIWVSCVTPAVRTHASLRLPSTDWLGATVPDQHQSDLLSDEAWSQRGFVAVPNIRRGEVLLARKDDVIGLGQAAAITPNESALVEALSALWPHAWVLYAAHAKRTVGHLMVTAAGCPEFEALLKLINIIYPNISGQVLGAMRASSAHDGPHFIEPLSLTRLSHYALADEHFRAEVNDFATNRYPFKELTLAALDACLSAIEKRLSPISTALEADTPEAAFLKRFLHTATQALHLTREDHTRYKALWESKLLTRELRSQRDAKFSAEDMVESGVLAMFEYFYAEPGSTSGKPIATELGSEAWVATKRNYPDVHLAISNLMTAVPAATPDAVRKSVEDRLEAAKRTLAMDWDNGAGNVLAVGRLNPGFAPATLAGNNAADAATTAAAMAVPPTSTVPLPSLAGRMAPEVPTAAEVSLGRKVREYLREIWAWALVVLPFARALKGAGQVVRSGFAYPFVNYPHASLVLIAWVMWTLGTAPAEVWERTYTGTVLDPTGTCPAAPVPGTYCGSGMIGTAWVRHQPCMAERLGHCTPSEAPGDADVDPANGLQLYPPWFVPALERNMAYERVSLGDRPGASIVAARATHLTRMLAEVRDVSAANEANRIQARRMAQSRRLFQNLLRRRDTEGSATDLVSLFLVYLVVIQIVNGDYIHSSQKVPATACLGSSSLVLAQNSSCAFVTRWPARIRAEMASANQPWFCTWCRKDVKATFNNCGFCGTHWQDCVSAPRPKSPRRQPRQEAWTYAGTWNQQQYHGRNANVWEGRQAPTKSPKRHTRKSPARPRSKSAKGKKGLPPPEPAWEPEKETLDPTDGIDPAAAEAQAHLRDLMAAVQQMEQPLTPDVQKALVNAQKTAHVDPAKQLQSASSRLTHAREQLKKAREARLVMHNSWAKFIAEALKRWNQHSEDFEARDAEHQAAIQVAMDKYKTAKQLVEASKEVIDATDRPAEDRADINDDELMADNTPSIQEDLKSMVQHFEKIRARQTESLDGSIAKKPRIEEVDDDAANGFGARALQPFGRGGV